MLRLHFWIVFFFTRISLNRGSTVYQTRAGVISKHQEVTYETREVFSLISKHREVMYQTREGVFHIYKSNTRKSVTSDNQTPRGDTPNTRSRSTDIETPKGNTLNTILYQDSETRIKQVFFFLECSIRIAEYFAF